MENINYSSIIWELRERLTKEVDPHSVVTYLVNCKVMTSSDKQRIEQIRPPSKRTSTLLEIIAMKGRRAYENFVKALEEDECFVAYYLVRKEMEGLKKEATRASEKMATLQDEIDQLRKDLGKEQQEHQKTRQELEEIEILTQELEKQIGKLEDVMYTTSEEGRAAQCLEETAKENDHQQKVVTSKHIQAIVDHVEEPLTMDLGACLELPTPVFMNIEEQDDLSRKKIWKVLIKWKQRKGKGATLGILVDVLYKLKQTEAVDKLLGMEGLEKEATRVRSQSAMLRDERDQLRTNLEEERQKHAITRQELKTCEAKLEQLLIPSKGNEESKTTKRKEEKAQSKVQQANIEKGNEEFESGKNKGAKAVTNAQQKLTLTGKHRTCQDLETCQQDLRGKLKPPKTLRPIYYDHRTVVKAKEIIFPGSGREKDAPTFKTPLPALPEVGKGNIGKKKPSSKILSEEEEENTAKNMDLKESKGKQQDSKRCKSK